MTGHVSIAVAAALLALTLAPLHAQRGAGAAPQGSIRQVSPGEVEAFHVRGNVWMLVSEAGNAALSAGPDGVLLVNTLPGAYTQKLLEAIERVAPGKPIRYIVNTNGDAGNVGGNAAVTTREGAAITIGVTAGNAVGDGVKIVAHENTYNRMVTASPAPPAGTLATDTFFTPQKQIFFNDEAIQLLHQPGATTDGDVIAFFRRSDVVVAGTVYASVGFPVFDSARGGTYQGVLNGLNSILDYAIPAEKEEGGTYIIPGRGRLADEADVVEYRDMATIIRDRIQDALKRGQTIEQIKAARLVRDYERRYGSATGSWTTDMFLTEAVRSLQPPPRATRPGGRP